MTAIQAGISNPLPGTECICSMCKCGKHNCPQQYQCVKPKYLGGKKDDGLARLLYQDVPKISFNTTSYKNDFDPKELPDLSKLKKVLICSDAPSQMPSRYCMDLNKPVHPELLSMSIRNPRAFEKLCRYYCPSHCVGTWKREEEENCLTAFKDRFVIGGPPTGRRKVVQGIKIPCEPFSKHTSYKLDYVPHPVEPRKPIEQPAVPPPPPPSDYSTTHKQSYPWPETLSGRPRSSLGQADHIHFGEDGDSMVRESTHMVEFQPPPRVEQSKKMNQREFRPPVVMMEGETTTGNAYPRWKVLPPTRVKKLQKSHWAPADDGDARCRVSTYQEDFDGVCAALCPAKMIENYGPKILEPSYNFIGSSNGHDFYRHRHCSELANKN